MNWIAVVMGIFITYCANDHIIRMSWKERILLSAMGILLILIGIFGVRHEDGP